MVKRIVTFASHETLVADVNPMSNSLDNQGRFRISVDMPAITNGTTTVRVLGAAASVGNDYLGKAVSIVCYTPSVNMQAVGGATPILAMLAPSAIIPLDPVDPSRYDPISGLALTGSCIAEFPVTTRTIELGVRVLGVTTDVPLNWMESISTDPDYLCLNLMLEFVTGRARDEFRADL